MSDVFARIKVPVFIKEYFISKYEQKKERFSTENAPFLCEREKEILIHQMY